MRVVGKRGVAFAATRRRKTAGRQATVEGKGGGRVARCTITRRREWNRTTGSPGGKVRPATAALPRAGWQAGRNGGIRNQQKRAQ